MGQLQDRIAVITGASTGIGQSIAAAFAAERAKTVLASRSREKLEIAATEIRNAGGHVNVVPTDVTAEDEVIDLFRQTLDTFGRVDILVNNAGVSKGGPTDELSLEVWQPEHQGVEAAGDAQQMLDRILPEIAVEVGVYPVAVDAMEFAQPVGQGFVILLAEAAVGLGAVAGGEDHGLLDCGVLLQFSQCTGDDVRPKGQPLAYLDGCGFVVESKG